MGYERLKLDIEPFETGFEFEDTPESFDEFAEEVKDMFPEYGEEERWWFDPESEGRGRSEFHKADLMPVSVAPVN